MRVLQKDRHSSGRTVRFITHFLEESRYKSIRGSQHKKYRRESQTKREKMKPLKVNVDFDRNIDAQGAQLLFYAGSDDLSQAMLTLNNVQTSDGRDRRGWNGSALVFHKRKHKKGRRAR